MWLLTTRRTRVGFLIHSNGRHMHETQYLGAAGDDTPLGVLASLSNGWHSLQTLYRVLLAMTRARFCSQVVQLDDTCTKLNIGSLLATTRSRVLFPSHSIGRHMHQTQYPGAPGHDRPLGLLPIHSNRRHSLQTLYQVLLATTHAFCS